MEQQPIFETKTLITFGTCDNSQLLGNRMGPNKKSIAWPTSDLVKDNICTSVSLEHKWTLKGLIRF